MTVTEYTAIKELVEAVEDQFEKVDGELARALDVVKDILEEHEDLDEDE